MNNRTTTLPAAKDIAGMIKPKRGEVWWAVLGQGEGSEQMGERPVLIIQNDVGNHYSPTVIVASITDIKKRYMPTHVSLRGTDGLKKASAVLLEQLRTIDKSRLINRLGSVGQETMKEVDKAIEISLGLCPIKEPRQ